MGKRRPRAAVEADSPRRRTGSDADMGVVEEALELRTINAQLRENPALCVTCGKELSRLIVEDLIIEDPTGDERLIPAYCYECTKLQE